MPSCFVIQPFDGSKFDKRFKDVFEPAIKAANLQAYRVDKDPTVEIPIEAIEEGIRNAAICLADITTDNPNVWYELGFAFAAGKPVVMVCSTERVGHGFPFDIQHRTIIPYAIDSSSDFAALLLSISERLNALLSKKEVLRQLEESEQVASTHGLRPLEVMVMASLASETAIPGTSSSLYSLKTDAEQAGVTGIGFSLAIRRLLAKKLVESFEDSDSNGNEFEAARLTDAGWSWIDHNETLFVLRKSPTGSKTSKKTIDDLDDDIPF